MKRMLIIFPVILVCACLPTQVLGDDTPGSVNLSVIGYYSTLGDWVGPDTTRAFDSSQFLGGAFGLTYGNFLFGFNFNTGDLTFTDSGQSLTKNEYDLSAGYRLPNSPISFVLVYKKMDLGENYEFSGIGGGVAVNQMISDSDFFILLTAGYYAKLSSTDDIYNYGLSLDGSLGYIIPSTPIFAAVGYRYNKINDEASSSAGINHTIEVSSITYRVGVVYRFP